MSILSAVLPNPRFENLGGGRYKTNSTLAGQGVDSVAFVSGRKPLSLPTDALPGVSAPIPTTSQKAEPRLERADRLPSHGQRVRAVGRDRFRRSVLRRRRSSPSHQSGHERRSWRFQRPRRDDRASQRALGSPASRGRRRGHPCSKPRGARVGAGRRLPLHRLRRCEPNGSWQRPDLGPQPYPLLNVVVQNHAPTLSDEDGELLLDSSQTPRSWSGPRIEQESLSQRVGRGRRRLRRPLCGGGGQHRKVHCQAAPLLLFRHHFRQGETRQHSAGMAAWQSGGHERGGQAAQGDDRGSCPPDRQRFRLRHGSAFRYARRHRYRRY